MAQTSELIFSTIATHKITGEVTKAELYLVAEDGKPQYFVSDHPKLVKKALAKDVLAPYNPFNPDQRNASCILAMIAIHGFRSFEE